MSVAAKSVIRGSMVTTKNHRKIIMAGERESKQTGPEEAEWVQLGELTAPVVVPVRGYGN